MYVVVLLVVGVLRSDEVVVEYEQGVRESTIINDNNDG